MNEGGKLPIWQESIGDNFTVSNKTIKILNVIKSIVTQSGKQEDIINLMIRSTGLSTDEDLCSKGLL
jgi:hypothetical protein